MIFHARVLGGNCGLCSKSGKGCRVNDANLAILTEIRDLLRQSLESKRLLRCSSAARGRTFSTIGKSQN